jgi:choline dehydrogenase
MPHGVIVDDKSSSRKSVTGNPDFSHRDREERRCDSPCERELCDGAGGRSAAVVDSQGKVFGEHGLRMADTSSFPFTPLGHTQGTAYAQAEKVPDEILKYM